MSVVKTGQDRKAEVDSRQINKYLIDRTRGAHVGFRSPAAPSPVWVVDDDVAVTAQSMTLQDDPLVGHHNIRMVGGHNQRVDHHDEAED